MKTIGLLGGMSWESTLSYYQTLNRLVKAQLGGLHSAKIILHSVDFAEIEELQRTGDWLGAAEILSCAAQGVEQSGADFLLICTNTMHKVADQIQDSINVPVLHIADATAKELTENKINKVGFIGTKFSMEQDFYTSRLQDHFAIDVLTPNTTERDIVHDIIYQELCLGEVNDSSRQKYLTIIDRLYQQGAQAVILGCTEIALLVEQQHTQVPLFDTTLIHAQSAVKEALS